MARVCLSFHPSVNPFLHPFIVHPSIKFSLPPSSHPSPIHQSIPPFNHSSVHQSLIHQSLYPSIHCPSIPPAFQNFKFFFYVCFLKLCLSIDCVYCKIKLELNKNVHVTIKNAWFVFFK